MRREPTRPWWQWATPRSLGPKEQAVGREVGCTELTGAVAVKTEACRTRRAQEGEYDHPQITAESGRQTF